MAFLEEEDYSVLVRSEIKELLLEDFSDSKLSAAEDMGISQVKNYLSGKYNTDEIFSKTADERNGHIVMIVLDCTLYHLYTSSIPKRMPEIRSVRYQDAIDWLKMAAEGKVLADLPKIKDEDGNSMGGIRFSSKYEKSNQRW